MNHTLKIIIVLTAAALLTGRAAEKAPAKTDPYRDVMAGQRLSATAAGSLEQLLAEHPDDLSARTKLLGYYSNAGSSEGAKESLRKHVFWIIKNRPESDVAANPATGINAFLDPSGYAEAKQLWLAQTKAQTNNPIVLGNAASFLLLTDRDMAEGLLKQAQKLEPNNPHWFEELGQLYHFQGGKEAAGKALAEFEKAHAADTSEMSRFYRLDDLAKSAIKAGETQKAAQYAKDLLEAAARHKRDWNYGNAIHDGNSVLGQVALQRGDTKQACQYLLQAGQTTGSPQLGSFGPNMTLAKQLLDKGEQDTVLQYFNLCRKFWKMGHSRLDTWKKEVEAGQAPTFGASLAY